MDAAISARAVESSVEKHTPPAATVAEGLSPFFELEIRTDSIETAPDGELPPAGQWVRIDVPMEGPLPSARPHGDTP